MVSFRFPFSFSQPPSPRLPATANASSRRISASALSAAALVSVAGAGIAISQNPEFIRSALNFLASKRIGISPMWGSLSLSENSPPVTESRTGMSFPVVLRDSQRLLGVGLRRKAVLGLKNIDVYAFGVYADDDDVKKSLSEKYRDISASELKGNEKLKDDLMECDVSMTIRLQIVYGRLSIRSVRSAFEESVGTRLQKFGGSENKDLLERFTSQFRDEYKIPKGSIIDLSKERGHVLRTLIDGKEVGSIQSKLLCRSILDLYIGNEPFDQKAKEDVEMNLAALIGK
ncbi:fatty-acid-binding protein 1 [Phtheirospermum japonicum]|uniref:Fatty-acid-binding protein 1 n=1 Tax=Phtheirospermum japonicum TaxID=374723 RepID=A0A830BW80_9LAMI|nr:fatty-acid-binding protein 1 [Phtheirospermum japonicum]